MPNRELSNDFCAFFDDDLKEKKVIRSMWIHMVSNMQHILQYQVTRPCPLSNTRRRIPVYFGDTRNKKNTLPVIDFSSLVSESHSLRVKSQQQSKRRKVADVNTRE